MSASKQRARIGTGFDTWVPMEVVVALWIVALLILALLAFASTGFGILLMLFAGPVKRMMHGVK